MKIFLQHRLIGLSFIPKKYSSAKILYIYFCEYRADQASSYSIHSSTVPKASPRALGIPHSIILGILLLALINCPNHLNRLFLPSAQYFCDGYS